MSETAHPIIADVKPVKVELKEGERYFWCRCGRSSNQPFCDGSHKGTGISPLPHVAEKDGPAFLCCCKGSEKAPFCDGTHNRLGDSEKGDPAPAS